MPASEAASTVSAVASGRPARVPWSRRTPGQSR